MVKYTLDTLPPEIIDLIIEQLILVTHKYYFPSSPSYTLFRDWNPIWPINDLLSLALANKSLLAKVFNVLFANFGTSSSFTTQNYLKGDLFDIDEFRRSIASCSWFRFFHDYNLPAHSFLHYSQKEKFYLDYKTINIPPPFILEWVQHLYVSSHTQREQLVFTLSSDICKPEFFPKLSQVSLILFQSKFPLQDEAIMPNIQNLIRNHRNKIACHIYARIWECDELLIPLLGMEQDLLESVKTLNLSLNGPYYVENYKFNQIPLMKNLDKFVFVYNGFGWDSSFEMPPDSMSVASISTLAANLSLSELELSIETGLDKPEWRIPSNLECLTAGVEMFYSSITPNDLDRFNNITHLELDFSFWRRSANELKGLPTIPIKNLISLALHNLEYWHIYTNILTNLVSQNPRLVNLLVNGLESNELEPLFPLLHNIEKLEILSDKVLQESHINPYEDNSFDVLADILNNCPNLKLIFLPLGKNSVSFSNLCALAEATPERQLEIIHIYDLNFVYPDSKFKKHEPLTPSDIFISAQEDGISQELSERLLTQVYAPVQTYSDTRFLDSIRKAGIIDFKKLRQLVRNQH
jgi:hypothetical protein